MRTTAGRILIGAAIGLVGLLLLDGSTTRLAAFGGWMAMWTLTVVLREAQADRARKREAAEAAALSAAAAALDD